MAAGIKTLTLQPITMITRRDKHHFDVIKRFLIGLEPRKSLGKAKRE